MFIWEDTKAELRAHLAWFENDFDLNRIGAAVEDGNDNFLVGLVKLVSNQKR